MYDEEDIQEAYEDYLESQIPSFYEQIEWYEKQEDWNEKRIIPTRKRTSSNNI